MLPRKHLDGERFGHAPPLRVPRGHQRVAGISLRQEAQEFEVGQVGFQKLLDLFLHDVLPVVIPAILSQSPRDR